MNPLVSLLAFLMLPTGTGHAAAECDECHHEIDASALISPHDVFLDDFSTRCQTCHRGAGTAMRGAQACSNCHHQRAAAIADQRLSATVAIHTNCWGCHEVGTGVEASNACASCPAEPVDE